MSSYSRGTGSHGGRRDAEGIGLGCDVATGEEGGEDVDGCVGEGGVVNWLVGTWMRRRVMTGGWFDDGGVDVDELAPRRGG